MAIAGVIFTLIPMGMASANCQEQNMESEFDLSALEDRLRETPAIGFFTKLALKDQINNLLDAVQAYHRSDSDKGLDQLRERYNLLLLKVQSLVQDEEPQLSQKIYASRDVIWCLLADPEEFSKL
jgi:hypothetical protein